MQKKEVLWVVHLPPLSQTDHLHFPYHTSVLEALPRSRCQTTARKGSQQRLEKRRLCKGYCENFQINFPSTQGKVFLQISWPHLHICASLFSLSFFPSKPLCPFNHEAYYSTVRAKQFLTTGNPAGIGRGQQAHALT